MEDNDADIFDPFLALAKSSPHFDADDIATIEETNQAHKKHVENRIAMDLALKESKAYLESRMNDLNTLVQTIPAKTRESPHYKHLIDVFAEKQIAIEQKYKALREKRIAVHGPYTTPPPSPDPLDLRDPVEQDLPDSPPPTKKTKKLYQPANSGMSSSLPASIDRSKAASLLPSSPSSPSSPKQDPTKGLPTIDVDVDVDVELSSSSSSNSMGSAST